MSMAKIRRRVNFYRSMLDPRDPDYEEPMEPEEEDEPPFDDREGWDGPYHYAPPGGETAMKDEILKPTKQAADMCRYTKDEQQTAPYPRVEYTAQCGFRLCIMEGYEIDTQTDFFRQPISNKIYSPR